MTYTHPSGINMRELESRRINDAISELECAIIETAHEASRRTGNNSVAVEIANLNVISLQAVNELTKSLLSIQKKAVAEMKADEAGN